MGRSRDLEIHGSRSKKRVSRFTCSMCRYFSNRYFNIIRHERRIHTAPKRQPQCCDIKFESKADYYLHCEKIHPGKRFNLTSQKKYGILAGGIPSESIVDPDTSKPNNQEYPVQTRYMLRSRVRSRKDTDLAQNSLASIEDSDVEEASMKSNKTSGYGTNDFSSMDSTSSSLETRDGEGPSHRDCASNNVQENDEKSSSVDSPSDSHESPNDENRVIDKSQMEINEIPASMPEERNDRDNFNREQSCFPSEKSVSRTGNDSMPSGSNAIDFEERKSASYDGIDVSKSLFDSGAPITSTPSNLPLKKRILQDLAVRNRENIENSRKPAGDRFYREPIKLEREIKRISKQCRQSRKERRSLRKKMTPSKGFSMYSDTENVPPVVSITYNGEARVPAGELCNEVTVRHREFLSSIDFNRLEIC